MNNIKLVKLKPEQWDIYKEIKLKSLLTDPVAFASTYEQAVLASDEEWKQKLAKPGSIWLLAKDGEKFIGLIGAYIKNNGEAGDVATIVSVYVDPTYREKGVGKLLMDKILNEINNHEEIAKVKIWVSETQKHAMELYKSYGFKFIGKKENEILFEGKYFDELIMKKELI